MARSEASARSLERMVSLIARWREMATLARVKAQITSSSVRGQWIGIAQIYEVCAQELESEWAGNGANDPKLSDWRRLARWLRGGLCRGAASVTAVASSLQRMVRRRSFTMLTLEMDEEEPRPGTPPANNRKKATTRQRAIAARFCLLRREREILSWVKTQCQQSGSPQSRRWTLTSVGRRAVLPVIVSSIDRCAAIEGTLLCFLFGSAPETRPPTAEDQTRHERMVNLIVEGMEQRGSPIGLSFHEWRERGRPICLRSVLEGNQST